MEGQPGRVAEPQRPPPDAICAGCEHRRDQHYGVGTCLAPLLKTTKAEGKVSAGSVCPCMAFTAETTSTLAA